MESRACGGCGSSGFMTLMTTNETGESIDRLAILQLVKDTPPMPMQSVEQNATGVGDGSLSMRFYELWNVPLWIKLFGPEPTVASIGEVAKTDTLRLAKIIKSPSGIMRARIYDIANAVWEPVNTDTCKEFPSLHKFLTVGYASSTTK